MRKDSPELLSFVEHLTIGTAKTIDEIVEKDEARNSDIEKRRIDIKSVPDEHKVIFRRGGKVLAFVKPEFKHLYYGKKEVTHRGKVGGGAVAGERVSPELTATEKEAAQSLAEAREMESKLRGTRLVHRRGKIKAGGRPPRKLPSMQVDPLTGERSGPGVVRAPSRALPRGKYIGAKAVSGLAVGGIANLGQALTDEAQRKMTEWVNYRRLSPEQQQMYRRAQFKARERKERRELRAPGLWEPKESVVGRIASTVGRGAATFALQNTASAITDIFARHPATAPLRISVDPNTLQQTMKYYYRKAYSNPFLSLAEAQVQQNKILEGQRRGDPRYLAEDADRMRDFYEGIIRDMKRWGDEKYGRGWLEDRAEEHKRSIVRMSRYARRIYEEAERNAVQAGVEDPSIYARSAVTRIVGTGPIAEIVKQKMYAAMSALQEQNLTRKINNIEESQEEYRRESSAQNRKVRNESKARKEQEVMMPSAEVPLEPKRKKKRGRPTEASKRPSAAKEAYAHKMRAQEASEYPQFGDRYTTSDPRKVVSHFREWRTRRWRENVRDLMEQGNIASAAKKILSEYPNIEGSTPKEQLSSAAEAANIYYEGVKRHREQTRKKVQKSFKTIGELRDMVGKIQSKGQIFDKMIASTPVSGLLLVREDLAGGRKYRKKRRRYR